MPTHNDYVSNSEFTRYVAEEVAYRARVAQQLEAQYQRITSDLAEIKAMVKETNGKTSRNSENILVVQRELEAIKSEDREIDALVNDIKSHGCAQFSKHEELATALGWSGKKKAAVAGGLVGTGALMWPALQQIAATVHDLLEKLP